MSGESYRVRHGCCCRCQEPAELYSVDVTPSQPPAIRPKAVNVHRGSCLSCIVADATALVGQAQTLQDAHEPVSGFTGWRTEAVR